MTDTHRLLILAGPSCAGKSPLAKALQRTAPELAASLTPITLYNSRPPRPGEQDGIDYHFRTRSEIEALRTSGDHIVMDVRGDLQALDIQEVRRMSTETIPFYEGNPDIGHLLLTHGDLQACNPLGIFLSPVTQDELEDLLTRGEETARHTITDIMRQKLLRRTRHQKHRLALPDLEEVERRCGHAWRELQLAPAFPFVLPNHDGEDSEHWTRFPVLLGDARQSVDGVIQILRGTRPPDAETWPDTLFSRTG